ncbi:MAG: fatty acid desaturase [bacterium]|nr:fatty acid desaturase [bacterium]
MTDGSADANAARNAIGISHAEEKRLARELSPPVAWPTLALALLLPATFATIATLGLTRSVPVWACTPILALVSYAHYTLVHEAIHGNVVSKPRSLAWINTVVGWIGALGMGIGWPFLQRTHVLHHSHTNTERDPDIVVKGTFAELMMKWVRNLRTALIPLFLIRYIDPAIYKRIGSILSPSDIAQVSAVTLGSLLLLLAGIATGHVADWFFLWFLPTRLGVLILNIFFQWLPHHPFDRTERYHNTRLSLWPGGTFLTLQQNLHLMHHLWPSVPFYNYARLYRALQLLLVAEGVRIEGLAPRSRARGREAPRPCPSAESRDRHPGGLFSR